MSEGEQGQPEGKAKTFAEWENIYGCAEVNSEEEKEAITKMADLASTEEEWELVQLWASPDYPDIDALASKKLEEYAELEDSQ